jgi:hypothetical protein
MGFCVSELLPENQHLFLLFLQVRQLFLEGSDLQLRGGGAVPLSLKSCLESKKLNFATCRNFRIALQCEQRQVLPLLRQGKIWITLRIVRRKLNIGLFGQVASAFMPSVYDAWQ